MLLDKSKTPFDRHKGEKSFKVDLINEKIDTYNPTIKVAFLSNAIT